MIQVCVSQKTGTWRKRSIGRQVEVLGVRYGGYVKMHGYAGTRGCIGEKAGRLEISWLRRYGGRVVESGSKFVCLE